MTDHERDLATFLADEISRLGRFAADQYTVWSMLCELQRLDLRVEDTTVDALRAFLSVFDVNKNLGPRLLEDDWLSLWSAVSSLEEKRAEEARKAWRERDGYD